MFNTRINQHDNLKQSTPASHQNIVKTPSPYCRANKKCDYACALDYEFSQNNTYKKKQACMQSNPTPSPNFNLNKLKKLCLATGFRSAKINSRILSKTSVYTFEGAQ